MDFLRTSLKFYLIMFKLVLEKMIIQVSSMTVKHIINNFSVLHKLCNVVTVTK